MGTDSRNPIAWMAKNPVAANLLMVMLLFGGILSALQIQKEVFPRFELDIITVSVGYPGAAPSEVETGVIQPVEEAIQGLEGIREINSRAYEGSGRVEITLLSGVDRVLAFQNIDKAIAGIRTFPEDANQPNVDLAAWQTRTIRMQLYGPVSVWTLRQLGERLQDQLLNTPYSLLVEINNAPTYTTHVEISSDTLREYNLTLADVSQLIRQSSQDIAAGAVRTTEGEILLRFQERKVLSDSLRQIDIIPGDSGVVKLGDIATIRDGFEEGRFHSRFNGVPSINMTIYRTGQSSPMEIEAAVLKVMDEFEPGLPPGVEWRIDSNNAEDFRQRLNLIIENGAASILIVFAILSLFLATRLGFWVMMGMAISYVGSVLFLPAVSISINMISLFGFLVALGIVVDDAIVVGENVFETRKRIASPLQAAITGTREVAIPVIFSVLTTIIAFVPLLLIPGETGLFWLPLPVVVIVILSLSLFEALYILPAHLAHVRNTGQGPQNSFFLKRLQQRFAGAFDGFVRGPYQRTLTLLVRHRYTTVAAGLALLAIVGSFATSKHMGIINMPTVAADEIEAGISMPAGTTPAQAGEMALKVTAATQRMYEKHNLHEVAEGIKTNVRGQSWVDVEIVMRPRHERNMSSDQVIALWRDEIGDIPGADKITFKAERGPGGWRPDVRVDLSHNSIDVLEKASQRLVRELDKLSNTADVSDSFNKGKKRIDFRLLPQGRALGLTPEYVGRQLRGAFYGFLAVRQLHDNNETEIRVKLPETERNDFAYLEDFIIRTPSGAEVPLLDVTSLEYTEAFSSISRQNGKRVISVRAKVEPKREIAQVIGALNSEILPQLRADYPGLTWSFGGSDAELRKSFGELWLYFSMAILAIYALLAVIFKSYSQPVVVLSAIPFGAIGAVIGHIIMGYDLSLISMMGAVALSGIVLNSALIMTDYANRLRNDPSRQACAFDAITEAGQRRFRPIVLTTLTTFGGLIPILFETSPQAQHLIPMAISLGFGVLFATAVVLVLVPCLYMVLEDIKGLLNPAPATHDKACEAKYEQSP